MKHTALKLLKHFIILPVQHVDNCFVDYSGVFSSVPPAALVTWRNAMDMFWANENRECLVGRNAAHTGNFCLEPSRQLTRVAKQATTAQTSR